MMEIIEFLAIFCGILVLMFGIGWLASYVTNKIVSYIEIKRTEKHPEFFRLRQEYSELNERYIKYRKMYISEPKREIDYIRSNWDYYTDKVKAEKQKIIDELQFTICNSEDEVEKYRLEKDIAYKKIIMYAIEHKLKWSYEYKEYYGERDI